MKSQTKQAFQSKSTTQLQTDLVIAQQELAKLRLELKTNKLKDLHAATKKRKEIALIKTLISQNQLKEKHE